MKPDLKLISLSLILISTGLMAQNNNSKGYYKDIFMDGGIRLTSRTDLPAARYLGLSIESYYSATGKEGHPLTMVDTLMQEFIMIGSEQDQNGILLYPDGEPRYRMIYVNGGKAGGHGKSLREVGHGRFQEFVDNGGSYVGSCAGAFMASNGTPKDSVPRPSYLKLWKGTTVPTGLHKSHTGMFVEKNSPLLKYYDFGGDMRIDSVRHNGGCYISEDMEWPAGTEILLRYDYNDSVNGKYFHRKVSSWAYKESDNSGRLVLIGSHPEEVTSGERLELMSSLILYAMDGNGEPALKCELQNNVPVEMSKMTVDNDPAHTRIGDRQYHHFKFTIPKHTKRCEVRLMPVDSCNGHTLSLFVNPESMAFNDNALYKDVSLGIEKSIIIDNPEAGDYYISVFGEDTVRAEEGMYGVVYTDNLEVLNGIPYKLVVSFK